MQNINFRQPGLRVYTEYRADGSISYQQLQPASLTYIIRSSSGYTGKRPKGKNLPPHAYSFNFQDISYRENTDVYTYPSGTVRMITGQGPYLDPVIGGAIYPDISQSEKDALYNKVVSKLTDKVRGDLDVSIDLAEAHKTAKMLHVSDRIVEYTRSFVGKRLKAFSRLKGTANAWLEYTYGVKPLVSTLYGVADENLRTVINNSARFSARSSIKYTPKTIQIKCLGGYQNVPVVGGFIKKSITLGVDMRTDQFDLARWSSLNPVSIAWELTPYSFVFDWFLNVGGYLRNMETYLLYASKFRSGYRTDLTVGDMQLSKTAHIINGDGSTVDYWFSGYCRSIDINRQVLSSYPLPALPSLGANLGSSRLLSAAALLGQLLGRR